MRGDGRGEGTRVREGEGGWYWNWISMPGQRFHMLVRVALDAYKLSYAHASVFTRSSGKSLSIWWMVDDGLAGNGGF